MSHEIKDVLGAAIKITFTPALANAVIRFVNAYESRGSHPEAFNSPYLGLHPCFFLTKDRDDFFSIFDVDQKMLNALIARHSNGRDAVFGITTRSLLDLAKDTFAAFQKMAATRGVTASEVRKLINEITSIDSNFKVASDPLNIFITYLLHLVATSNLQEKLKRDTLFKLLMLLQYKFFTSLVNHRFKYKPDESVMVAMFESLTNKFDIKQYGTWKRVMESRAAQFVLKDSLHYDTFLNFDDDKKILYVITDVQTRIRNQINIVTHEFMQTKERHDKIGTYSHMGTDVDGEKVIMSGNSGFDMMIASVYNDSLSVSRFLDDDALLLVSGMFRGLPLPKLRSLLIAFSELAVKQAKSGQSQLIREEDGIVKLIGAQILIQHIIQKSYRYCAQNNVNMRQIAAILKSIKDVYSSSRISDEGIIQVRESVNKLILELQSNRRDATVSSFRIAFVLYITILTFKYLK